MERFRFDDECGNVYELEDNVYVYCCNYFSAGIDGNDSEDKKYEKMNEFLSE